MIKPDKWQKLQAEMKRLEIHESDLREQFIIGSGKGGQNLHKTASCVNLLHVSTGIVTKCQQDRSRDHNRYYARKRLCEKIAALRHEEKTQKQVEIEKIRRQKRRRSAKSKRKMLEQKHARSALKVSRQKVRSNLDEN